jgi:hypothetical protein
VSSENKFHSSPANARARAASSVVAAACKYLYGYVENIFKVFFSGSYQLADYNEAKKYDL